MTQTAGAGKILFSQLGFPHSGAAALQHRTVDQLHILQNKRCISRSAIKIANIAATSWDGIRFGITAEGALTVQVMAENLTVLTLTAEQAGVTSFAETFNLKVTTDITPVESNTEYNIVVMNIYINDVAVAKNVSTGGVKGIGSFAGLLTWNGAAVTVATPAYCFASFHWACCTPLAARPKGCAIEKSLYKK